MIYIRDEAVKISNLYSFNQNVIGSFIICIRITNIDYTESFKNVRQKTRTMAFMIQINKTTKDETFHMSSDIRFSASAILFSAISRLLSATFLGFINCKTGDSTTIICSKLVKGSIWSTPSGIRLRYKIDWPLLGSLRDFCFVNSSSTRFLSFWLPLTSNMEPLPPPPIVLRDGSGRPLS